MRFKTNMSKMKSDIPSFETGGGRGDTNWFKLKDGRQVIRILPPWSEEGLFYKKVGYHRKPGKSMDKVVCPNYTFGQKDCPICKARAKVYKNQGKDAAKNYAIQKRALMNVLDMKKADSVVYVLDAAASIINPVMAVIAEMDSDDLIDPKLGSNIVINRKNDGGFTKYDTQILPGQVSLKGKGYDVDAILEELYDLDNFVKEPAPDDFTEILEALNEFTYGDGEGSDSEDEDDDTPAPKKKSKVVDDDDDDVPAPKKKSKPVEDDEDEEDEDETPAPKKKSKTVVDDDEDEEETPAPKKKLKSAKIEEDEDDSDDEDEDETPAPKKKSKPAPVEDDEDEEEEEEVKPKSKMKKKAPVEDDEDEDLNDLTSGLDDFDADEPIPF